MDKPRRPWFQIHLSTAIVMMFVAGGLIWTNIYVRHSKWKNSFGIDIDAYDRGWPYTFHPAYRSEFTRPFYEPAPGTGIVEVLCYKIERQLDIEPMAIFFNTAIATSLLLAFCFGCEYFLRRREARAR
jgi:hypothetical protein